MLRAWVTRHAAALFVSLALAGAARAEIVRDGATLILRESGCEARLEPAPNGGSLLFRPARCPTPLPVDGYLAPQLEAARVLLAEQAKAGPLPPLFHLAGGLGQYRELGQRIAAAAAADPGWDARRARPRTGPASPFVERLARAPGMLVELERLFAPFGLAPRLVSVEKVMVERADRIDKGVLLGYGIAPAARLPFDMIAWFRLEPR